MSYLPTPWPGSLGQLFSGRQLDTLRALAAGEQVRAADSGYLVHGDLDVTHIYAHDGRYSGIIDFGEMRGADRYFDLGHFLLHDGETRTARLFASLLDGYRQVESMPEGCYRAIRTSAILLGLRQLAWWLSRERECSLDEPLIRRRVAELSNLLQGDPAKCDGWGDEFSRFVR